MKKVLIAQELHTLVKPHASFLNRSGMQVYTAGSNDELIAIHKKEQTDLIVTQLDLPGIKTEDAAARIQEDAKMRQAPILMVCPNSGNAIERCARCGVKAVILRPVNPLVLLAKAQQLLAIAWRETFRAIVNVTVEGKAGNSVFFCRSRDVSISGMLIETDKALDQGSKIVCSFYLPESVRVEATAEIVRTVKPDGREAPKQYGVKFVQITPEDQRALEMFIHSKSIPAHTA